jgi:hypothetical protein
MQVAPMQTAPMQAAPVPTAPMPTAPMPAPMPTAEKQEMMANTSENLPMQLVYPEIFYRLQPFIILVCDQFKNYNVIPTQEMVEQVSDNIYSEACQMYPDLRNYNFNQTNNDDPPLIRELDQRRRGNFHHDFFMRRFRRRGSLQDLISILLLSEIFRRF